ncbi:DUF3253 domain-containing protein [Tropicimonas sp. IMCC34011]|uniref:DUF3253 domain-containing protein n=1 Tax=Tropicimonas sp. IMCC34011 TaxID=2248759 RepID=UPI001E3AEEF4|nr:DUF3253 domain-containing protein [Tropicimonas sp. IMCC34011]
MSKADDAAIAAELRRLARERGADKTFCPSEVARAMASDWRPLMEDVRRVAGDLVSGGELRATQKGVSADPVSATGPIRLARAD